MKTLRQVLENFEPLEESRDQERNDLIHLARAGFISESRVGILARAIRNDITNMTMAEKKVLQEVVKELSHHVMHEQKEFFTEAKAKNKNKPWDAEVPVVLVLRRKAIRVYPDDQKIALYYSQALNRHISIPFGPGVNDLGPQISEDELIGVKNYITEDTTTGENKEMSGNARETFRNKLAQIREEESLDEAGILGLGPAGSVVIGALSRLGILSKNVPKTVPKGAKTVPKGVKPDPKGAKPDPKGAKPDPKGAKPARPPRDSSGRRTPNPKSRSTGKAREYLERRKQGKENVPGVVGGTAGDDKNKREKTSGITDVLKKIGRALNPKGTNASQSSRGFDTDIARRMSGAPIGLTPNQSEVRAQLRAWATDQPQTPNAPGSLGGYNQRLRQFNEETSIIDSLKYIVENNTPLDIQFRENKISINRGMAKKVLTVYESLSKRNKTKYERMLTEDAESFKEALNFALKN